MKKTLLLFITLLTITVTSAQTVGDLFTVGNNDYEVTSVAPNEVKVTGSTDTDLVIPATVNNGGNDFDVTLIPSSVFNLNTAIKSVSVEGDTEIGLQAFIGCTNLASVDAQNVTAAIGNSAFLNCTSLTTVNLSSLNGEIGDNAFKNCTLLATLNIGNATAIGPQAFKGCAFTSLDMPAVTLIEGLALWNCSNLAQVTIPILETILAGGFNGTGLTSITLPSTLTTLSEANYNIFKNSASLMQVTVEYTTFIPLTYNPDAGNSSIFVDQIVNGATLIVPAGTLATYQAADVWKDFATITEAAPLSVNSQEAALGWNLYPSLATDFVSIKNNQQKDADVTVYDLTGRALLSKNINNPQSEINISNLNSGIYLFKVKTSTGEFVKRIIKQ